MGLSRVEQETIINFNDKEDEVSIYTASPIWLRKLERLAKEYPDTYKLIEKDEISATYVFPKKMISLRKPRIYTDEQKEELKARGQRLADARRNHLNN